MKTFVHETKYIHEDQILLGIYDRAVSKFFNAVNQGVVFFDLVEYIKKQVSWKKQDLYYHGLPLLYEVCTRIGEDFNLGVESCITDAECYRDVFYAVFDN